MPIFLRRLFGQRPYAKIEHVNGGYCIMEQHEVEAFLECEDDDSIDDFQVSTVWMRPAAFEALPEFEGF